jgi:hypothetical protein
MSLVVRVQALSDNAKWIVCKQSRGKSLPMLKGTFTLDEKRKNATLQATALGIYDVRVNGQSVTEHELKPGWTDYRKEVTYQTMEIGMRRKGVDCLDPRPKFYAFAKNADGGFIVYNLAPESSFGLVAYNKNYIRRIGSDLFKVVYDSAPFTHSACGYDYHRP